MVVVVAVMVVVVVAVIAVVVVVTLVVAVILVIVVSFSAHSMWATPKLFAGLSFEHTPSRRPWPRKGTQLVLTG